MRTHLPLIMSSLHEVGSVIRSRMTGWNLVTSSTSPIVQLISWFFVRSATKRRKG